MSKTQERPTAKTADRADNYRSLLVHAEPGTTSTRRVEVAARLADDVTLEPLDVAPYMAYGMLLPVPEGPDGFFMVRLRKRR